MKKQLGKTLITVSLGVALIMTGTSAFGILTWHDPITKFEDDNMEWFFDTNQNGIIDTGDRIVSIFEINTTVGVLGGGPTDISPEQELTGILDVTVSSTTDLGGGLFGYTFGSTGAGGLLSSFDPGTMTAIWLDNTPDLDIISVLGCGSFAACSTAASDGALWLTAGFGASVVGDGPDNPYFNLTTILPGANDPLQVQAAGGTSTVAVANFGFNVMFNGTGRELIEQDSFFGPVDLIGTGLIQGGEGLTNGAFSRSDFDFQLTAIPEPGSLALIGLGLLGIFGLRKRIL